jgi:hypothetical protein
MRILAGLGLLLLVGCQVPSRVALDGEGGRTAYNVAIQATNSKQMLLNLVRLRYADSPLFLDVSSITTQTMFRSAIAPVFPIPGFNSENPFKLGGDLSYQDQPIITYTPLEGPSFATRLLRPIDLHTIQLLCYSGWDIDRIFRMMIQNFEDLANYPENSFLTAEEVPQYQSFIEALSLLRYFQKRGELQLGVKLKENKEEESSEEVSLQISFPKDGEQGSKLANLIHSKSSLHGKFVKEISLGFNENGKMGIMPRSILSCMYHLSHGVQVPTEHVECGMVQVSAEPQEGGDPIWKSIFSLIVVHSSRFPPKNAFVSVKYRDNWFYIDECDLSSKRTFALLLQLYNLNAIVPKNRGPILSLPLG